jgi:two-component system sensor histidine kinase DegS
MHEVIDSPLTRIAQEAERRRIARELHDGVVQSLTALVADLEYFRLQQAHLSQEQHANTHEVEARVEAWQELAQDSLAFMRQALGGLRTQKTHQLDFGASLHILIDDMHEAGYSVTYDDADWPILLPFEYTSHLYAIIREAFTNIRKHAHASHVTLFLFQHEEHVHLSIGDDGIGMSSHTVDIVNAPNGYHQGLLGLYERTQLLGGHISITSEPAKGTRIDVEIPFAP